MIKIPLKQTPYKPNYACGNSHLSMVVRTQNRRCITIPKKNKIPKIFQKDIANINDNMYATIIVIMVSIIAIFTIRYECIPFPGLPSRFLYGHWV